MFNYFKKRAEFKKQIKGIFDNWEIDSKYQLATKNKYALWIGSNYRFFEDWSDSNFLIAFSPEERRLLWEELDLRIKTVRDIRKKENADRVKKEFNITTRL